MKKALLFPFASLWVLLSLVLLAIIAAVFQRFFIPQLAAFQYFALGFAAYLLSAVIFPPRRYQFWNTFFHELTHSIWAVLLFSKPQKLVVSTKAMEDRLGYMEYQGRLSLLKSHLIALSPYFFSTLTFLFVLIYIIVMPHQPEGFFASLFTQAPKLNGLLFAIGFSYSYHLVIAFRDAKPYQSDFHEVGFVYGMTFVCFMQLLFLLFFMTALTYPQDSHLFLWNSLKKIQDIRSLIG